MKFNCIALGASSLILLATTLNAASTHTWVGPNGNDTNAGTSASPYRTFATAVVNTAPAGTVSVLGPADYGPVTITQSITIDGTGGGSIDFTGDGEGIYIDAGGNANIVIRNLSLDGGGTGSDAIFVASSGTTNVVNVLIDGCLIAGFDQIGVGLGSESPMYLTVRNTSIQGGTLGVRTFQSTGAVVYDHVQLDRVTIQGASSAGVFTRNGSMDIIASTVTGALGLGAVGIEADTNATINVQNTMITGNTDGVCIFTGSTATIGTSTTVADNATNVEACGGAVQGAAGPGPAPRLGTR
jgi:hypothetical protein